MTDEIATGLRAGMIYFAIVFVFAFVLGVVRTLVVAPLIGELPAVLLEIPLMLAFSWLLCGQLVSRIGVSDGLGARTAMSVVAFALLMAAEIGLAPALVNRSLVQALESFRTVPGLIGLAGQIAFASFPLLQRRWPFRH
jgi:hypothetical protein